MPLLREILISFVWTASKWWTSASLSLNIFTEVQLFGFPFSGLLQNEGFQQVYHRMYSPWWKKIWISIIWTAPKWRIWVILAQKIQKISTPRGKHYGNWQRRFYSIVVLFSYSEEQRAEIWYTKWSLWTIVALVKTTSKPKIMDYWILRVFCL